MTVPFSAVRGFYDPSVNFELEFDVAVNQPESDNDEGGNVAPIEIASTEAPVEKAEKPKSKSRKTSAEKAAASKDSNADEADKEAKPSADVVSLDAFRKK